MLKKYRFIVFGLIIIFILLSLYSTIILYFLQKDEEPRIHSGDNSIFNSYTPSELAENLADAVDATPLISKEKEVCCGGIWYKYHYQDNYLIGITTLKNGSLWAPKGVPIEMFGNDNPEGYINISNSPWKAGELVQNIWVRFLNNLDYQLNENDYNISIISHSTWAWKVFIRQVFNNNIPLMNTGVVAIIEKETSSINHLSIYEWSSKKIEKNTSISLEEAKDIVNNNAEDSFINKSLLNFTGYIYFSDNVHYRYIYIEEPEDENKSYFNVFRYYVNIDTGNFQYSVGSYFGFTNESEIYEREKISSQFGMY